MLWLTIIMRVNLFANGSVLLNDVVLALSLSLSLFLSLSLPPPPPVCVCVCVRACVRARHSFIRPLSLSLGRRAVSQSQVPAACDVL